MAGVLQQSKLMFRVGRAWSMVPGWRLGQLVANASASIGSDDPFYVDDEELVAKMEELAAENRQR